jgi:hypothetical protein
MEGLNKIQIYLLGNVYRVVRKGTSSRRHKFYWKAQSCQPWFHVSRY